MASFQFLHAADVHLDSPLLNLDQYDGAPVDVFRDATRQALNNLVDLAIERQVRFVLIAGDLYDGECRDSSTPLHFRRQMVRLDEAGIQVFIIQGNHDAQCKKAFSFELPSNVRLLSARRPETVRLDDLRVAIHGQGFSEREVTEDLSRHYPSPIPGWLNIGLLHTSCGHYEAHDRYAPSSVRGLTDKGYQYWALGHIHQRQVLTQGERTWIVYPGNLQGRHIREEGPKGCELVTVDADEIQRVQRQYLDVVRWRRCSIDAQTCESAEDIVVSAQAAVGELTSDCGGRPLAVRLEVQGDTPAHRELVRHVDHWRRRLREAVLDAWDDQVWVEKVRFQTRPPAALGGDISRDDGLSQLLARAGEPACIESAYREVRDDVETMLRRFIPTDPRVHEDGLHLGDSLLVEELARDVRDLLTAKLLAAEESR